MSVVPAETDGNAARLEDLDPTARSTNARAYAQVATDVASDAEMTSALAAKGKQSASVDG